jgi:hypothetical protein
MSGSLDLVAELQKIYDSKINVRISWLWDCGIDVWLGDEMNGYVTAETMSTASEIAPWLQEAIVFLSGFNLRRFVEPGGSGALRCSAISASARIAARVNCPCCGAASVVTEMEEVIGFVCSQCGNSVKVDSPKVQ